MIKNNFFTEQELSCKCCGKNGFKDEFLSILIDIRKTAKIPFIVNSAFRCVKHNRDIGGVENSAHTKGLAIDIAYKSSFELYKIIKAILVNDKKNRFRILIYSNFVHLDMDDLKPYPVIKRM